MKTIALLALLTNAMVNPALGQQHHRAASKTAAAAPTPEPAICKSLASQYEEASKKLAYSQAEDAVDDSAARSTMREAQNNNVINQARMTMDVMKSNGCKSPTFIPSAARYGSASAHCMAALQHIRTQKAVDRLRDRFNDYPSPDECNIDNWTPDAT